MEKFSLKPIMRVVYWSGYPTGCLLLAEVFLRPNIARSQKTADIYGNETTLELPEGSRHDVCVTYMRTSNC